VRLCFTLEHGQKGFSGIDILHRLYCNELLC
jgi:hypothetical protein